MVHQLFACMLQFFDNNIIIGPQYNRVGWQVNKNGEARCDKLILVLYAEQKVV